MDEIDTSGTKARYIPWQHEDHQPHPKYATNTVSTAKYDPYFITFLPLFLFEMFSRVAYFYFLIQVRPRWLHACAYESIHDGAHMKRSENPL
jgi:hypothetical protein